MSTSSKTKIKELISQSVQDTLHFARQVADELSGGDILLLTGELGTGKTTFVQGVAKAFGIREKIKSPTFTVMHAHKIKPHKCAQKHRREPKWFVHADVYRLKKAEEIYEIGLMDWLGRQDAVVVVEWGEKIKPLLRSYVYKTIRFQYNKRKNERFITPPPKISLPR